MTPEAKEKSAMHIAIPIGVIIAGPVIGLLTNSWPLGAIVTGVGLIMLVVSRVQSHLAIPFSVMIAGVALGLALKSWPVGAIIVAIGAVMLVVMLVVSRSRAEPSPREG
jgi:hypothetical protein